MKPWRHILSVGVLFLGAAVGWYEHGVIAANRIRLDALREQLSVETMQFATLTWQRETALRQLQTAQAAVAEPGNPADGSSADASVDPVAQKLDRTVDELKAKLKNAPEHHIPELALLTEADWYKAVAVGSNGSIENPRTLRILFGDLRRKAKDKITMPLWSALQGYLRANDGILPAGVEQLSPYLKEPLDPAILRRYEIVAQGRYADLPLRKNVVEEAVAVDPEFDFLLQIKRTRDGTISAGVDFHTGGAKNDIARALQAYRTANAGVKPTDPALLATYFTRPVDLDELRRNWRRLGFAVEP